MRKDGETTRADEQALTQAKVCSDGAALLDFFRHRTLDVAKTRALIHRLGDPAFTVRERTSADLVKLGIGATPLLREALKDTDLEVVLHRTARE